MGHSDAPAAADGTDPNEALLLPKVAVPDEVEVASPPTSDRVHELEGQLRYALADLENLHKRFAREVEGERLAERERSSRPWLPVLDSLDLALAHAGEETAAGVVAGIESIRNGALAAISQLGFPRFEDVGKPFDPARHEAVGTVESGDEAGIIVSTVRPGYGAEQVLRPASVIVSRKPTDG